MDYKEEYESHPHISLPPSPSQKCPFSQLDTRVLLSLVDISPNLKASDLKQQKEIYREYFNRKYILPERVRTLASNFSKWMAPYKDSRGRSSRARVSCVMAHKRRATELRM